MKHFFSYFRPLWYPDSEHNIACLDGWRALAILFVVFNHCAEFVVGETASTSVLFSIGHRLWAGVDLFFVLSGFLIGTQLLIEVKNTNSVYFSKFFFKRSLRLWPLFYVVLFSIAGYRFINDGHSTLRWTEIFYLMNYFHSGIIVPGGWSLATEEQFYLLVPLCLLLSTKLKLNSKQNKYFLIGLLCAAPLVRFATVLITGLTSTKQPEYISLIYNPLHTHYEGLVIGLLIAHIFIYQKKLPTKKQAVLLIIAVVLVFAPLASISPKIFNLSVASYFFGSLVFYTLLFKQSALSRILSLKFFHLLSRLSYGIYLTYNYWIKFLYDNILRNQSSYSPEMKVLLLFTTVLIVSLFLTSFLWAIIEKPFLILRSKYLPLFNRPRPPFHDVHKAA